MSEENPVALNSMPDLIRALQARGVLAGAKEFDETTSNGCACMGEHSCNGFGPHIEETLPAHGFATNAELLAELRRQLDAAEEKLGG